MDEKEIKKISVGGIPIGIMGINGLMEEMAYSSGLLTFGC